MNHDERALNHHRKQIFKSKSVLKKRKLTRTIRLNLHKWIFCATFFALPYLSECQFPTRDPRWYSREGDYNYQWPNPGDPEYRLVIAI